MGYRFQEVNTRTKVERGKGENVTKIEYSCKLLHHPIGYFKNIL